MHVYNLQFANNFSIKSALRSGSDLKRFTDKHEWISVNDAVGTVGITDYAQVNYCVL
jgi:hypothetical protein